MPEEPIDDLEITSDDRIWAAVAYLFSPLSPVFIYFMRDKRSRPFIRAHFIQAFFSGIGILLIGIPLAFFTLGCASVIWLIFPFWAYRAYHGNYINIPLITGYIMRQNWG